MGIAFLLIFCSFCGCFHAQLSSSMNVECHSADLKALEGFAKGLIYPIQGWGNHSSNCCNWKGVTCDSSILPRVVGLELAGQRLGGNVSESLADLVQLQTLNLSGNFLTNSQPLDLFFFFFKNIQVVDLSSNDLSGYAPLNITSSSIRILDISRNRFVGDFDPGFCKIAKQIQVLNLSSNSYAGRKIPPGFGNCTSLEHLSLASNFLTGILPQDLFALSKLKTLDLHDNWFSGELSFHLGNLSNLVKLDISFNKFSGWLPNVFFKLGMIQHFTASSNNFTGPLPISLCNSPTISTLSLDNNSLSGPIDVLNCSAMVSLTSLNLGSNRFVGSIGSLSSCEHLRNVDLGENRFYGNFPDSFKNLKSLSILRVSKNSFSNISATLETLQHCKNLTVLILRFNFHGEVMPANSNLRFENMRMFMIADCGLTGSMPQWLSSSTKLQILSLSNNAMSGVIPSSIGELRNLFYVDLCNNSLSGSIPKSFTQLQSLINVSITLKGEIFEGFSDLKDAILEIPPSLFLSYNRLSGPIWVEFGNLKDVHVLDLSNNRLSGNIPSSLSNLKNLEVLDLSFNILTGFIPDSLRYLHFLSRFSVAYNHLEGSIPSGGQFDTFPESSFVGNFHLCGYQSFPCERETRPEDEQEMSTTKDEESLGSLIRLPLGIGVGVGFILTVAICFLSGMVFPKEKKLKFSLFFCYGGMGLVMGLGCIVIGCLYL